MTISHRRKYKAPHTTSHTPGCGFTNRLKSKAQSISKLKTDLSSGRLIAGQVDETGLRSLCEQLGAQYMENQQLGAKYMQNQQLGAQYMQNQQLGAQYMQNQQLGAQYMQNHDDNLPKWRCILHVFFISNKMRVAKNNSTI